MRTLQTYDEDLKIAQAILNRDEVVTRTFLYKDCRGMLLRIIHKVFDYPVEYEELISALYLYIMERDGYRLRQYQGRSTIYLWLRTTATRFFILYRDQVIDDTTHESLLECTDEPIDEVDENEDEDLRTIRCAYDSMPNRRYAQVLQRLVIDEAPPQEVAEEMGITVDNLYNIKKRAITQLTQLLTQSGIRKR